MYMLVEARDPLLTALALSQRRNRSHDRARRNNNPHTRRRTRLRFTNHHDTSKLQLSPLSSAKSAQPTVTVQSVLVRSSV